MADETQDFDTVSLDKLDPITALSLDQLLAIANINGKLFKSKLGDLITFIAPFISAVGASNLVFPDANNVLPNPTTTVKGSIVGAGTYTWAGGSLTTTALLNIISTNQAGTAYVLVKAVDTNAFVAKTDYNFGGVFATVAAANSAIPNTVVNGKNQRDGKRVDIGTAGNYITYWWSGGTADANLKKYFDLSKYTTTYTQLFNANNILIGTDKINSGYLQDTNLNSTGGIVTSQSGFQVANIPFVTDDIQQITVSGLPSTSGKYYRWLDSSGVLISGSNGLFTATTQTFTRPAGGVVFQFNIKRGTTPIDPTTSKDAVMVNKGATAYPLITFSSPGYILSVEGQEILAGALKLGATMNGKTVATTDQIPLPDYAYPNQLLDFHTIVTGDYTKNGIWKDQFVSASGTITSTTTALDWIMANILVDPTKSQLTISNNQNPNGNYFRFVDSTGAKITGTDGLQLTIPTQTLSIPSNAYALQVNIKRNTASADILETLMINYGANALPYEVYIGSKVITGFNGVKVYTAVQSTQKTIKAYGDSTTAGADLTDPLTQRWTTLLAPLLGITVVNDGSSGARAEEITSRLGGEVPRIQITGGTIIPNTFVAVTYNDIQPVRSGEISSYEVKIVLPNGTSVKGLLDRTNGFKATNISSNVTAGTSNIRVFSETGKRDWSSVIMIGQGINNEPFIVDTTQTIEDVKKWYSKATSVCKEYFVWGVLDRGLSEAPGTVIGDYIVSLEAWLSTTYGTKYIPFRKYISSAQALTDALIYNSSFTPTADDTASVAAKVTPPSFRSGSGSVHMNALGHQLQALYFKKHLEYFLL